MEKAIIILDGVNAGKTKFINIAKENERYWVWNINPENVIKVVGHKLLCSNNTNAKFRDFSQEVMEIANRYYNFEERYVAHRIENFEESQKAQLLIIHSKNERIKRELLQVKINCFNIKITDDDTIDENYCKTLNYRDENFKENVLEALHALTKEQG